MENSSSKWPNLSGARHLKTFGFAPVSWLQDKTVALQVLAVIGIWQNFGFTMVLFLAGLAGIPRDLYEAAELDGAPNALARFQLITWPSLKPITAFVLITSTIRSVSGGSARLRFSRR
ncbi:ABC transporter permease subunit [Agrobacterium vitis]|uniref:ABC transporter permease subunit n=1 Tax=Agrobacterium vitis TaxID=373 RepID=A0A6L6VMG7_AGRVI|nr:ABC transporter permease subunit [Agrobacterium vitis]